MGPLQTKDISYSSKYPSKKKENWNHISIFSELSAIRVKINYKRKKQKNTDTCRLKKNMSLNNQRIIGEIKEEI